jgi:hypothetical protein
VGVVEKLDPHLPELHRYAGKIHAMRFKVQGRGWKEAVAHLREAAVRAQDNLEICKEIGELMVSRSQYTEARKWYRRVLDSPHATQQEKQNLEALMGTWPASSLGRVDR